MPNQDARSAARLHRFTPVYGEWPVCDLCGEREDAPIHKQPEEPSAATTESRHRLVLTVYEPRWHGFAKWQTEIRWPGVGGIEWSERQHDGFLRRHGSGVLSRSFPSMRLSRATSKRLARKEIEANG